MHELTATVPNVSVSSNTTGMVCSFHSIKNLTLLGGFWGGKDLPTLSTETDATDGTEDWAITARKSSTGTVTGKLKRE